MNESALAWATEIVLASVRQGDTSLPSTLFLLRRYAEIGSDDIRAAAEDGLSCGLDAFALEQDPRERCEWLGLFADATEFSDDPQLAETVHASLPGTIDKLESLIRADYEPGQGLFGASPEQQCRSASALVTAFELTGRLPYSMLAEELLGVLYRSVWDEEQGSFRVPFKVNCEAARLLCRLAALGRDPDYAAAIASAGRGHYERDAARLLGALTAAAHDHESSAAIFGLALLDSFALTDLPN